MTYAALWWNRGLFPNDEGWEPTLAYLLLHGWRPYVDYVGASVNLTGIAFFVAMIGLFGFKPWVWHLAAVVLYGLCVWLLYRILCYVTSARLAFVIAILLGIFFCGSFRPPYFYYNWHGVFYAFLAMWCVLTALRRSLSSGVRFILAGLGGFATIAAGFCKPPFGLAAAAGIGTLLLLGRSLGAEDRPTRVGLAWSGGAVLTFGGVLAALAGAGLLDGFVNAIHRVSQYNEALHGDTSFLSTLANLRYFLSPPGAATLACLVPAYTIVFALAARRPLSRLFTIALPALVGLGVAGWVVWRPVVALTWFVQQDVARATFPFVLSALLPLVGWALWRLLTDPDRTVRRRGGAGAMLVAGGGIFWLLEVLTHPTSDIHAVPMSIGIFPAGVAVVLEAGKSRLPVARAYPWLLTWGGLLALAAVAVRFGAPERERPYWEWYESFEYPALRHLRASNAGELDRVLFTARQVVETGGSVFVYPKFYMFYPLVGSMPYVPTLLTGYRHFNAPYQDQYDEMWKKFDTTPPDLIVIQTNYFPDTPAAGLQLRSEAELLAKHRWRDRNQPCGNCVPPPIRRIIAASLAPPDVPREYELIQKGSHYLVYRRNPQWKAPTEGGGGVPESSPPAR